MNHRLLLSAVSCLIAACGIGSAAAAPFDTGSHPLSYELQMAGVGSLSGLKYVVVPGPLYGAVEFRHGSQASTYTYSRASLGLVEAEVAPSSMWMFANTLSRCSGSASAGAQFQAQVHTINSNPQRGAWTDLGDTYVAGAEFPAMDLTDNSGASLPVLIKLMPSQSTVVPAPRALAAGPAAPPSIAQPAAPLAMTAPNFVVSIPGVDASGVVKIEPIKIEGKFTADNLSDQRLTVMRPSGATNWPLVFQVRGTTAWGLQAWQDVLASGATSANLYRDITIQFMTRGNAATLFTLRGVNAGLESLHALRATDGYAQNFEAVFFVERWELTGPGTKVDKMEAVLPTSLPVMSGTRK